MGWEEQKRQVCLIHSPNDDIKLSSADRLSSSAEPNINRAFTKKKKEKKKNGASFQAEKKYLVFYICCEETQSNIKVQTY